MFFQLENLSNVERFSYILSKHPDNRYEANIGTGRVAYGHWKEPNKTYVGFVKNEFKNYIDKMRMRNASNYLAEEMYCVCIPNLKGFDQILRSALRGKGEDYEGLWGCTMGPYTINPESIISFLKEVNIETEIVDRDNEVFVLRFTNTKPTKLATFLQKVYVVSCAYTQSVAQYALKQGQTAKVVSLSSDWMKEVTDETALRLAKRISRQREDIEKITDKAFEERIRTHEMRHNLICKQVEDWMKAYPQIESILELGCGSGMLLRQICKTVPGAKRLKITGIDKDDWHLNKYSGPRGVNLVHTDITFPYLNEEFLYPDILILTEVLEHLVDYKRKLLINLILNYYKPNFIIITVPNVAYNEVIGLNKYRHPDHKIEYTQEQLDAELAPLYEKFQHKQHPLDEAASVQCSFIVTGIYNTLVAPVGDLYEEIAV